MNNVTVLEKVKRYDTIKIDLVRFYLRFSADNDKNSFASASRTLEPDSARPKDKTLPLSSFDDEGLFDIGELY